MAGDHRLYPEVGVEYVELREVTFGGGFTVNANENPYAVVPSVELWIDHPTGDARPAIGNLRLTPDAAIRLAESLILAAERIATDAVLKEANR